LKSKSHEFDIHDIRILAELQRDARLTMAELGRRVHLSQPATTERVRKLEAAKIITGYHAQIDRQALGYGIHALVRVGRADLARMTKLAREMPEVLSCYNVTGDDSWVLEIVVVDVAHLESVVKPFCELADTSTSVILKVVVENRRLLPPGAHGPEGGRGAKRKPLGG